MVEKRFVVNIMAIVLVFLLWGQLAVISFAAGTKADVAAADVLRLSGRNAEENVAFQVENMYPGDKLVHNYRVEVAFTDTVTISFQAVVRSGYEKLSEVLELTVRRTDTEEVLYEGLMRDMPEVEQVLTADGASKQELCYEITAGLNTSVGNAYQNQKLVADFNWWMAVNQDSQENEDGSLETESDSQQGGSEGDEEQLESPSTGDDSHIAVWTVSVLLSLFCLIWLVMRQRKESGNKKRCKLAGGIFTIVFLTTALGITTLALVYYRVSVEENAFETGNVSINLNDGKPIITEEGLRFEPGMAIVKTFFLENNSTCDVYYRLYFSNIVGESSEVLEVTIQNGEKVLYSGTLADMNQNFEATDDLLKEGEKRELTATFYLAENQGEKIEGDRIAFDIEAEAVQAINNSDRSFE